MPGVPEGKDAGEADFLQDWFQILLTSTRGAHDSHPLTPPNPLQNFFLRRGHYILLRSPTTAHLVVVGHLFPTRRVDVVKVPQLYHTAAILKTTEGQMIHPLCTLFLHACLLRRSAARVARRWT